MQHNNLAAADEAFKEGLRALKNGHLIHAHECFTRAIELDPNHCLAYSERGAIRIRREMAMDGFNSTKLHDESFNMAIADFSKAIEINPQDSYARYRRGLTFREMDEYAQSILDFLYVIENNGALKSKAIKSLAEMLDNSSRSSIYRSIKQLQSTLDKIKLYDACLNEQTLLGTFFWKANIVGRKPNLNEAPLKKMQQRLNKLKAACAAPQLQIEDFFVMDISEHSPPTSPLGSPVVMFKRNQKESQIDTDIPLTQRPSPK